MGFLSSFGSLEFLTHIFCCCYFYEINERNYFIDSTLLFCYNKISFWFPDDIWVGTQGDYSFNIVGNQSSTVELMKINYIVCNVTFVFALLKEVHFKLVLWKQTDKIISKLTFPCRCCQLSVGTWPYITKISL